MEARDGHEHAIDMHPSDIESLIFHLADIDETSTAIAFMMWQTGLRFCDILQLEHFQVEWTARGIRIEVRVAKNIRSPILRKEVNIPIRLMENVDPKVTEITWRVLRNRRSFSKENIGTFNERLAKADCNAGADADERHPTSYTLRRSAMQRFIRYCTNRNGIIDWQRACLFSLHETEKTLRAYYHRHVSDDAEEA
jgi:integrase